MKRLKVIEITHPEHLFSDKKPLIDPWGDCQSLTACLDPKEQEILAGNSEIQKTLIEYGNSPSLQGLISIRIQSSTPESWQNRLNGNRWKTGQADPADLIINTLRHTVFAGGDIQHYQIWLARWALAQTASIKSLLSRKNNQTLVNLDIDPRGEKLEWAVKSAKENPKRRIILFGTRRLPNGIKEFSVCAHSAAGNGIFFRSNLSFEIQPQLI
jgi:hypothetical protein